MADKIMKIKNGQLVDMINPVDLQPVDQRVRQNLFEYDEEVEEALDKTEDILDPSNVRLAIKPLNSKYEILWQLYKKQVECFWTSEMIDFSTDYFDFNQLNTDTQHFIKMILAFFAGADSIVNNNIKQQFQRITVKEADVAYAFQQMMENIHGEVYGEMLVNIVKDETERDLLINAFRTVESIKMMIEWGQAWTMSSRRIGFHVMAFTIFEGLMFSGAFAAIYWLKRTIGEDKMKGLVQSNNYIARDEGLHTIFGCMMYDFVRNKLSVDEAVAMMMEAVDVCKKFVTDAIRIDLIGMNTEKMFEYIEYCADRLLVYTGYEKIYNVVNPFDFMETIGFLNKDNFFEKRSTDYQRATNKNNTADWEFKVLDDY